MDFELLGYLKMIPYVTQMNHIDAVSKFHKKILHFWWKMNNIFCFWLQGSILEVVCIVLQMDGTNVERCLSTLFQIQRNFELCFLSTTLQTSTFVVFWSRVFVYNHPQKAHAWVIRIDFVRTRVCKWMNENLGIK